MLGSRGFAAATGVASIITRPDGTPITKPSRFTRLCSEIVRRTAKGCANCYKIANWLIGQVRDATQTEGGMRAYAREIGADETAFLEAFREVPAMSGERFRSVAQSLFTLANQLSTAAYQNVLQARACLEVADAGCGSVFRVFGPVLADAVFPSGGDLPVGSGVP